MPTGSDGQGAWIALSVIRVTTRGKVERDDKEPAGSAGPSSEPEHWVSEVAARNEVASSEVSPSSSADAVSSESKHTNLTVRLVNGSEEDYRAGIHLAHEAHQDTIFRDIPFSEDKARAIIDRALAQPDRNGLIYAVSGSDIPLSEDGLYGFASVHAGEYFLGTGTLIATVQTLNVSQRLSGTLLGGNVALRLVQAVRHWAKTRNCEHLLVHVTNGVDVEEADRFFRRCGMKTIGGNYSTGNF
ncbi:hypothetical protein [Roseibium sp. SCP14]|uniref:hypothetical protein n=1 Tax=Roseibium sp. SCP14 TaxID=3141375 RepID=UPI003338D582